MTKKILTLLFMLLIAMTVLASCSNSSYYEEILLQECRSQLSNDNSISAEEIEQIGSMAEVLTTSSMYHYEDFEQEDYPAQYDLSSHEEKMIQEAKRNIRKFIKSTLSITEKDKEKLLNDLDLLTVVKIDEPFLPTIVHYSNAVLFIDNTRASTLTTEDIELELMRFLRLRTMGVIEDIPYQGSIFESEMAYTILFSHFKDGVDLTGYNLYHKQILDFIGVYQEDALFGYFYGYEHTMVPQKELDLFVSSLEQGNEEVCQKVLVKWRQQLKAAASA